MPALKNQKPLSPQVLGLNPIGEIVTPKGGFYQVEAYDYSTLAQNVSGVALDAGYYSLEGALTDCSLVKNYARTIENSSVPAPLNYMMPVESDGEWYQTRNYLVNNQPDLSAFSPICCGAGMPESISGNLGSVDYHCSAFAVAWQLCLLDIYRANTAGRPVNPEAYMMTVVQQIIDYGSSYVALHGNGEIRGLLNNDMVSSFWMPAPLLALTGVDVMTAISAAVSSLDPNNIPAKGYTLWLPGQIVRRLAATPYSNLNPSTVLSIIQGGCPCPSGHEAVPGMITAVRPMELLRGALPGIGSGDIGFILPTADANENSSNAALFWQRPIPALPLERQRIGLTDYGCVICLVGDVVVMQPRNCLKILNV